MYELERTESVSSEATILVGVLLPDRRDDELPLEELAGLAAAAGARVAGRVIQRREAPNATTYLGSGKVEELKCLVDGEDADVVVFDNDLSPAQTRNLEKALGVKVLDRTELILDIFATRAQTHEARLAVELAQLEYARPRLKRMWTHLSRYTAGMGVRVFPLLVFLASGGAAAPVSHNCLVALRRLAALTPDRDDDTRRQHEPTGEGSSRSRRTAHCRLMRSLASLGMTQLPITLHCSQIHREP